MRPNVLWLVLLLHPLTLAQAASPPDLVLSEIVADPQTDWTQDGRVTGSDEFVELQNLGAAEVDLAGWTLRLQDSSPSDHTLGGVLPAGARLVVQNPAGDLNNDGHVLLLDAAGHVRDEVRFGSWPNATAPSANANADLDEALRRLSAWTRGPATPGRPNDALGWRTLSPAGASGGWIGAGANVTLEATVIAGPENPLHALQFLRGDEVVHETRAENASRLAARVALRVDGTEAPLRWRAARAAGAEEAPVRLQVDASAPTLPALPTLVWRRTENATWSAPPASDDGVGGVEYQWRAENAVPANWSMGSGLVLGGEETVVAVLRARDALNNTSPWSSPVRFGLDARPPHLVSLDADVGQAIALTWEVRDEGSGLAGLELVRRAGKELARWDLGPDVRQHVDPHASAPRYEYTLTAIDAAGNRATFFENVTTPSGVPAIRGIRISKPIWEGGPLEVRIDFDRAMDPAVRPLIALEPPFEVPAGRFLANRSTYLLGLPGPPDGEDGRILLRVLDAKAADGQRLRVPASAVLVLDRTAPVLRADAPDGPTREPSLRLVADDVHGARIAWRLSAPESSEPIASGDEESPANITIPRDGHWRVRATATDTAGHRSAELRLDLTVDRTPPTADVMALDADGLLSVRMVDGLSGVDWDSIALSDPTWRLAPQASKRGVTVQAGANATAILRVADLAGNEATIELRPVMASVVAIERGNGSSADAESWDVRPTHEEGATPRVWWPSAAAFVGGIAAAIPIRRTHRRRARCRSFARRLRAVRARAATRLVKDGTPG